MALDLQFKQREEVAPVADGFSFGPSWHSHWLSYVHYSTEGGFSSAATAEVHLPGGGLVALTIYSEMRGRRFRPGQSEDRIFRCQKCGLVYTDDPDVDRSRCSQCGKSNDAIQF